MKSLDDMTEPELQQTMNGCGDAAKRSLPPGTAFIVLATPFNGKISQYVSNVDREDAAAWMRETLQRWDMGDHVPR